MSDELVEVVDDDGATYAVVTRARMRAENLRHRSVFIVVVDGEGRLLAHQRAGWKDVWPGRWDIAFGGVLAAGESYEDGARRELAEEVGLGGGELELLGFGRYQDDEVREIGAVFRTVSQGPFHLADGEVVAIEWVPLTELERWMAGRPMVPDSVEIVGAALARAGS